MYTKSQIKKGIKWTLESPSILFRELNRQYYSHRQGPGYNHSGIDIFEQDWDTLLILDACRFDIFEKGNDITGSLESRISRGSHTSEFLRGNFTGKELHDTVYSTASPQFERRKRNINAEFHSINNVWDSTRWDNEIGTVPPSDMTSAGIDVHQEYPHKRHIIHYVQPHYPFINTNVKTRQIGENDGHDIWEQKIRGQVRVSSEELWNAYQRNFRLVLESVKNLLKNISGKIVITSDHGNMFGELSR